MFAKPIVLAVVLGLVEAFNTRPIKKNRAVYSQTGRETAVKIDTDNADNHRMVQSSTENVLLEKGLSVPTLSMPKHTAKNRNNKRIDDAEAAMGMPWCSSIENDHKDDLLIYMPFWEWQMQFMKDNLTNLRLLPCTCHDGTTDFTFKENCGKKARVFNLHLASDEYRKIRMTYYDAGTKTQVFNSLWYPNPDYNLPVLGIDVLQFNNRKHLAVVDFQPIHQDEHHHSKTYEHLLEPIRESYPNLQGKMSARFYDETQFFSKQMLFSRFDERDVVQQELMPAFQQYVRTHVEMVKETPKTPKLAPKVLERQRAYDTYSAERDPAAALFEAMFGKEWADLFMFEFLFSMSEQANAKLLNDEDNAYTAK